MPEPAERRDSLGRRIGYNWWREMICAMLLEATLAWEQACESVTYGYETETAEYAVAHPRPNLKDFLIGCAGMNREPEEQAA